MSRQGRQSTSATLHAEHIGGIDETTVEFHPGITALVGPNATNRTSLLQAVAGAIGSDRVTLKGDASAGEATLALDDGTFTRRLERTNGSVAVGGDPYLEDPELADLYALLLEDNEVRRAVRRGEDLRELVMRPVDTRAIRESIADLVDERQEVDAELDHLDAVADRLPGLEAERSRLRSDLDDVERRLAETRAAMDDAEREGERTDVERRLDETLSSLQVARTDLEATEDELAVERASLASLREEREGVAERYESLPAPDEDRLASLEGRIEELRRRKGSVESTINELHRVIRFNEERLDGSGEDPFEATAPGPGDDSPGTAGNGPTRAGSVTDELLPGEATTTCWTCGSEVERGRIEETVDRLRTLRGEHTAERGRIVLEIDDLVEERDDLAARREERERLADRLDELDADLRRREASVEDLEARREELAERVGDLEGVVDRLKGAQQDELLTLQERASELAFERDRLDDRLGEVESEIEDVESDLDAREELAERREAISAELADLRSRIDRIEAEAVEAFDAHMAEILDELGYDNVERIWIESTERAVEKGRNRVAEQTFELHVVRRSDSGTVYEDTVEHLSESEREVVGLVVALAGYLVHDVAEQVPFMLLDSLEMIDGQRLVELVSHLAEHVPYLVVVLLPDHAEAFDGADAPTHRRITDI